MILIRLRNRSILRKIRDFYIEIWYDRLVHLTLHKYSFAEAYRNYLNVFRFFGKTFDDRAIKETKIDDWKRRGWKEIEDMNWHFAVIVQLDLFGNHIATVQDCCHDKDYHNDTMETKPFKMDNPDDRSHLVDWKEIKLKTIIRETIYQYLKRNIIQ